MDLMTLSSGNPREQPVLTKQNRCLCAQCHPNVSSHTPCFYPLCETQGFYYTGFNFCFDLMFLSQCYRAMCDKMRDKTTCVTAGMFTIYAVRFHHLFQMFFFFHLEDLLPHWQLHPVCPWARSLTFSAAMIRRLSLSDCMAPNKA